jgi:hypothetical protein
MPAWNFLWITDLHYELPDANFIDDAKEVDRRFLQFRESAFSNFDRILEFSGLKKVGPQLHRNWWRCHQHRQQPRF